MLRARANRLARYHLFCGLVISMETARRIYLGPAPALVPTFSPGMATEHSVRSVTLNTPRHEIPTEIWAWRLHHDGTTDMPALDYESLDILLGSGITPLLT